MHRDKSINYLSALNSNQRDGILLPTWFEREPFFLTQSKSREKQRQSGFRCQVSGVSPVWKLCHSPPFLLFSRWPCDHRAFAWASHGHLMATDYAASSSRLLVISTFLLPIPDPLSTNHKCHTHELRIASVMVNGICPAPKNKLYYYQIAGMCPLSL